MSFPLELRQLSRLDRAIEILDRLFAGRRDTYATFDPGPDGKGVQYSGNREDKRLTADVWREHIKGNTPIGVYPLVKSGDEWVSSWACVDIDQDKRPGAAMEIAIQCVAAGASKLAEPVSSYIETTKSGQVHLWFFFEEPTSAWKVRALARLVLEASGHKPYKRGKGDEVVICPAHDNAPPKDDKGRGGYGMCIYVPWYGNNAKEGRQVFVDPATGEKFPEQLDAMEAVRFISPSTVAHLIDAHDLKPANVKPIAPKSQDEKAIPKAPAGEIPALSDMEFANLCAKLPALRAMRENPASCSYKEWFAGMMHLVPFADGRDRAHQLSRIDGSRYDANITERQWGHCVSTYSREDAQPEARTSQRIIDFWRGGGRPDVTPISPIWAIWNGCFCKRKFTDDGREKDPIPISNFTASVICEEYIDDGTGNRARCVRIRGALMTGVQLPEIQVPTEEWTGINTWLHKGWGFRPVVYGNEKDVLRCISLCGQDAPERLQYTHTGWTASSDGKPLFLTPNGPRGSDIARSAFDEGARVVAPEKLKNYSIPESATDAAVRDAFLWIERFLECGDLTATAPVMACIFLAPLYSFLNLDFALFLTGHTGTHKSSLVAAAMAVWGSKWSKDTMPASFNDTANALEGMGFHAKDLPLPIDNYVPSAKGDVQATLKRISHSFGDHAGRGRMNAKAELVAARPFRAFPIITGEDVPFAAGAGATNRYYIVPMQRETLRLLDLEAVQEAGWSGKMAPAMTHYLGWLTARLAADPEWHTKVAAFHYKAEKEARRVAAGKEHDRLTSQTAWMRTGMELIRQSHPDRQWAEPSLAGRIDEAFAVAITNRRTMSQEASLGYRFMTSVNYLVQAGKIHGVEVCQDVEGKLVQRAPMNKMVAQLLGWTPQDTAPFYTLNSRESRCAMWVTGSGELGEIDNAYLCIRGDELTTEIKQQLRGECPIVEGHRGISQALMSDGILRRGPRKDRITWGVTMADGHASLEVWKLSLRKVLQLLGWVDEDVAPPQG